MKSKVLTKSLRGISQILTAFVCCCVLGFATTTSANAQNDYPLNVTVELTGVAHNMDDGIGSPEVIYQIAGETIIVDGNFLGFERTQDGGSIKLWTDFAVSTEKQCRQRERKTGTMK